MSENQKDPVVTPETEKQTKKARTRRILSAFLIATAALIVLAVVIVFDFLIAVFADAVAVSIDANLASTADGASREYRYRSDKHEKSDK